MSAVNPYSPPVADVADAAPSRFSQPRVWSWRGRIGRLRFLAYVMGGYLLVLLVAGVAGGLGALAGSDALQTLLLVLGIGVYVVQYAMAAIQRSHDMDWSGWTALGLLVPLLNLVWVFKAGTAGANRFGDPPPPNTTAVKLLAWIPLVLFVLGILAAVALPAYQGYQLRQKAAQGAPV